MDRLHPLDEHENWLRVMRNMNDDKQVHAADAVRLHKDGTLVHVAMTLTPIVNEAQELIGVNAMMRSIEDKIRARITELTLKRQSKYFEAIVNSSDDAIISNDLHGIVQSWNLSAERLFGYTAKEMIGQSIMAIVGHDKEIEEKRLLDQLIAGTPVTQLNTVRRRKNGTDIHVSISMSTLTDDTDAVVGVSTIARDISDRIVAEQTIWQHANFDILTHLPNQRLLTNRAQQVLPECTRRQEKAAVVYIDIDRLKDINDELGHACGDALLVEVAARMSRAIRMQDTIAHLGETNLWCLSTVSLTPIPYVRGFRGPASHAGSTNPAQGLRQRFPCHVQRIARAVERLQKPRRALAQPGGAYVLRRRGPDCGNHRRHAGRQRLVHAAQSAQSAHRWNRSRHR